MSLSVGKGLDLVRLFYSLLPQRHRWVEAQAQAAEFVIDETFGVPGVGTVVAGEQQEAQLDAVICFCYKGHKPINNSLPLPRSSLKPAKHFKVMCTVLHG